MQLCFKNDSSNSTLSIDSFSLNGDIIHPTAVPTQIFRLALAQALRHLQIAFIVFFSSIFGLCLNEIIDALEGKLDPFRVIKDDLLHHLVSLVLSKWSWYVKTEYRAPRHPKINLKNPSGCAKLLQQMFKDQLILGLTSFDAYNEELLFRNQQTPYAQLAPTPKVPITMVHDQLTFNTKYCARYIAYTMGLGTPCKRDEFKFIHVPATDLTKN